MSRDLPALRVTDVKKSFDGVQALRGVSLEVRPGEVHGLVGENGAGKSTLIKIVSGVLPPDAGVVAINGVETSGSVSRAQEAGLAALHQELSLVPFFDAAENIALGTVPPKRAGVAIDWGALRERARRALDRLGVDIPVDEPVARLSPALQAMVTIARALSRDARLLILDEPTAALTEHEITRLFGVIRRLRDEGVAVVYVSHRLEEIFDLCERVTVMRDGEVVTTQPVGRLSIDRLIELMVGRPSERLFPERRGRVDGAIALEARDLTGDRVRHVSLRVRRGEVLGIAGLGGSGRSELLRLLAGAQRPVAGAVVVNGVETRFRSPKAALRAGVALVPEERRTQGLVLNQSVAENLLAAVLRQVAVWGTVRSPARERARARQLVEALRITAAGLDQVVAELSGGNQQKVVLGKTLARQPRVLLLDEPTRGIDVGTKAEVYRLIRRLADEGHAIVVVSSELPEVLGLADRVVVLREGEVAAELDPGEADEERVLGYCYGRSA